MEEGLDISKTGLAEMIDSHSVGDGYSLFSKISETRPSVDRFGTSSQKIRDQIEQIDNPTVKKFHEINSFGGAIISVSHDRKYLREVCNKVYNLDKDGLKEVYKWNEA